jgi:hypothetical protein
VRRVHVPCRAVWCADEKWIVPDTIWRVDLVRHEHQSVGGRCVFQSVVCKVTMCCVMKYVPTTQDVFSKRREDLAGKCRVVTYDGRRYMMWCQIIMAQQLRNLTNTSPEPSRSRALTIFAGSIWSISTLCFPTAVCTSTATSFSSYLQECSRT